MNRLALITGASGAIGGEIARSLAEEGYDLILLGNTNAAALDKLMRDISDAYNVKCTAYAGDVADEAFVDEVFAGTDRLDVLVNNAGISYVGLLQEMSLEDWNRVLSVNLTSAFLFSRKAARLMVKNKSGSIVNISSMWGRVGASMEVAYSASKGGINAMTMALAKELAPCNIQVNAIAPGTVDTKMNDHLSDEEKQELAQDIPAGRFASAQEIGRAVVSVISAGSSLTGQVIGIDGGYI